MVPGADTTPWFKKKTKELNTAEYKHFIYITLSLGFKKVYYFLLISTPFSTPCITPNEII